MPMQILPDNIRPLFRKIVQRTVLNEVINNVHPKRQNKTCFIIIAHSLFYINLQVFVNCSQKVYSSAIRMAL